MTWESLYNLLGIKDFIYFISSSEIQDMLFPIKLVFIFFAAFFFVAVIYLMFNSSWMQYKFIEDLTEFFSWQAYGQKQLERQINQIKKRMDSGNESDCKLAIIDADDFLAEVLDNRGYDGKNFEESIRKVAKLIVPIYDDVMKAHEIRNSIVYNPNYKVTVEEANEIIKTYETAVRNIGMV